MSNTESNARERAPSRDARPHAFVIHYSLFCIPYSLLLLPLPVPLGEGLSAGDVEVEALFGLEVVFDEPLGLVVGCFVLDNAGVLEQVDGLVVDGEGVAFESEEHDVGFDERMDVRELAEELSGVALADGLEAVEAERVL